MFLCAVRTAAIMTKRIGKIAINVKLAKVSWSVSPSVSMSVPSPLSLYCSDHYSDGTVGKTAC